MKNDFIKLREKDWRRFRIKLKIFMTLTIIFIMLAGVIFIQGYSLENLLKGKNTIIGESITYSNNSLNQTNQTSPGVEEDLSDVILLIVNVFVNWESGFFVKLLILLGIIYLIQVMFTLTFDILELLLLFGVLLKKIFKLITYPIKYLIKKNE